MELDFHLWRFDWCESPTTMGAEIADLAVAAEQFGVRTLSVMDHFFQMDRVMPAEDPMMEGYTTLGFIAGRTTSLRLRMLVGGVTYRHPGLLAKTMTTLDVLSGGRAEFGIGAAWYEREHVGLGVPFPPLAERFERLEETLEIVEQMWRREVGEYAGKHYRLAETLCVPPPVSAPRPRIVIGGSGERKTLRLVARFGDVCNVNVPPDELARKLAILRGHCEDVGRDPSEIEVTTTFRPAATGPDDIVAAAQAYAAVGASTLVAPAMGDDPAAHLESTYGPVLDRLREIEPTPWY